MDKFESAFEIICSLVEDFKAKEAYYLSSAYQEAEVRKDFIDKFFTALGWDVLHNEQKNPYEQEVKVEKGIKVSGAQKRADYAFCLAPNFRDPKFYVEAKKPSKDLFNADYYFQTIRYGWHKSTPIAILTDFEEFHVLDCRYSPDINTILNRKVKHYHYSEYTDKEKFAEIYWLFSKEAVANKSLEKYAETLPKVKSKKDKKTLISAETHLTIDEAFLMEIDGIREKLAKAFKKNDDNLNSEELTEATQRTVNRLVFIRFLEDKLIEQQHYVSEFGKNNPLPLNKSGASEGSNSAWKDFISICRRLDVKYNGIVFKKIFIDDEAFKGPADNEFYNICQDLCHLHSRFLFNEIPIHILGSIYERFLGKVVNATDKRVRVEEKPEVRKAGGVYYTPKYIVDYIVQNTIGKLIEGKTSEQIATMKFADIACGSGSFLIGTYECLLDYHSKYYQKYKAKAKIDGCIEKDDKMVLSIKQKQKILLNNIFGVDIDNQAVEVTQLSLYLKLLEDETTATANEMMVLFHEKILPDMSKNIICGNSLIETDILTNNSLTDDEERKLNPMDFETAFPEIMRNGGFDAVVGNPPYFSLTTLSRIEQNYFLNTFKTYDNTGDIYCLFFEKGLIINKIKGILSFITSNQWLQTNYGKKLKSFILENSNPDLLINFGGLKIFQNATVDTSILILTKETLKNELRACHFKNDFTKDGNIENYIINNLVTLKDLQTDRWIIANNKFIELKNKIKQKGIILQKWDIKINYGIKTGFNEAFIINEEVKNKLCYEDNKSIEIIRPILRGRDVHKYTKEWANLWLIVTKNGVNIKKYNAIFNHLFSHVSSLKKRADQGENWWNLRACIYYDDFEKEKIIYPETTVRRSEFLLDKEKFFIDKTCFMITGKDLTYLNGILASSLMEWFLESELRLLGKNSIQYSKQFIEQIPIPKINFTNQTEKSRHDKVVQLVEQMLDSKKKLAEAKTEKDKSYLERRCTNLDIQIDELVYELYGLTSSEIDIIEKNAKK